MEEEYDEELEARKWRQRRRIAYIALYSIFVVLGVTFWGLSLDRLKVLTEIITMFILSMAGLVGAYMGLSTWYNKGAK